MVRMQPVYTFFSERKSFKHLKRYMLVKKLKETKLKLTLKKGVNFYGENGGKREEKRL